MASRRKNKLRDERLFDSEGWFPISADMWLEPGAQPRKLRIIADVNFPSELRTRIRKRGIDISPAQEHGFGRLSDEDLLGRVSALGCILFTLDADFWSDRKVPLNTCTGVVQIDCPKGSRFQDSDGFELLIVFLKTLGWLSARTKIKASTKQLYMKGIDYKGRRFSYEIRPIRPLIYARESAIA